MTEREKFIPGKMIRSFMRQTGAPPSAMKARYFCPNCGGLLKRKHLTDNSSLADQLPCSKCGYDGKVVHPVGTQFLFFAYDHESEPTTYHLYEDCPVGAGMEAVPVTKEIRRFHGDLPTCKRCLSMASTRLERQMKEVE